MVVFTLRKMYLNHKILNAGYQKEFSCIQVSLQMRKTQQATQIDAIFNHVTRNPVFHAGMKILT